MPETIEVMQQQRVAEAAQAMMKEHEGIVS